MKTPRFPTVKSGAWVQPVKRGYLMACCDCALVHKMDFRITDGRVQFRAFRTQRHTNALRKRRRIRVSL